jgi:hypothetical protein
MKKPPPEIEKLMWNIAETGNPQAIDEFGARFPEFRGELMKRMAMVRGLKHRPDLPTSNAIPSFKPGAPAKVPPAKGVVATGVVFAVLAVGALGYTLSTSTGRRSTDIKAPEPVRLAPPSEPQVVHSNSLVPPKTEPAPRVVQNEQPAANETPPPAAPPKWQKPQVVKIRKASLLTVVKLVAANGGLKLEIAPGMPDPQIEVDYDGMNAEEILRDLGRTYKFTPMLNDDDSVILVPAVDPNGGGNAEGSQNTRRITP